MPLEAGSEQKYTTKTTNSLASPFPDPTWPVVDVNDQGTMRDLLCELLIPIGQHRRDHVEPSRGKRARKRKRVEDKTISEADSTQSKPEPPPAPEVLRGITVGYNSTHRALEDLVQRPKGGSQLRNSKSLQNERRDEDETPQQLAAVFVDRASQPKIMHNHLPFLLAAASRALKDELIIHLVALPSGSEGKLSTALHIPRVGLVGVIRDAQGAKPLLDCVASKVPPIDLSWLQVPNEGKYLPLKLETKTAKVPVLPAKSVRRDQARIGNGKSVSKGK